MRPLRRHPHLRHVDVRRCLAHASAHAGRPLTLATVPDHDLEALTRRFDFLWAMGVWRRSPAARERALAEPAMLGLYEDALPDWKAEDVDASPYAILRYELDPALGAPGDLAAFRRRLEAHGVRLIVDFVAGHVARDHAWTLEHPERFVRGASNTSATRPGELFVTPRGDWIAHGRDPNFPTWTDTAQLDLFHPETRAALREQLLAIAEVADGVRCDTAMLNLSDVFGGIWGWALHGARPRPSRELWAELIEAVKTEHPGFTFVAEAYWGLENRLLELGFDYAYDKHLYDLLLRGSAAEIRQHLSSAGALLERGMRFIENHDETRAVAAFGRERSQAAAIATLTLPGLRHIHDGQIEGRRLRRPIQLLRARHEPIDEPMVHFYERLLGLTDAAVFHDGVFELLEVGPTVVWDDSHSNVVAWRWTLGGTHRVVALNQSGAPACARLRPPAGGAWSTPAFSPLVAAGRASFVPVEGGGLDVTLDPWAAQLVG